MTLNILFGLAIFTLLATIACTRTVEVKVPVEVIREVAVEVIKEVEVVPADYEEISEKLAAVDSYLEEKARSKLIYDNILTMLDGGFAIEQGNPEIDFSDIQEAWETEGIPFVEKAGVAVTRSQQALDGGAYLAAAEFMISSTQNLLIAKTHIEKLLIEMNRRVSPPIPTPEANDGTSA